MSPESSYTGRQQKREAVMIQKKDTAADIFRYNVLALLDSDTSASKYWLSRQIHTCDNYVPRILAGKITPNLDHISSVSSCFRLKSWEMLYPVENITPVLLTNIQILNRLPASLLPLVWDYMAFLLSQENSQENRDITF